MSSASFHNDTGMFSCPAYFLSEHLLQHLHGSQVHFPPEAQAGQHLQPFDAHGQDCPEQHSLAITNIICFYRLPLEKLDTIDEGVFDLFNLA